MIAWVDSTNGIDPVPGGVTSVPDPGSDPALFVGINDPEFPYKTLQQAIDAVYCALIVNYTGSNAQGLVYVLPGLYGQNGVGSSGDVLPIKTRDRVHIQGLGARTCIVRGGGPLNAGWPPVVLPRIPVGGSPCNAAGAVPNEVLFDCRYLTHQAPFPSILAPTQVFPPWTATGVDTTERIDGLTFQGGGDPQQSEGGVQLLFTNFVGADKGTALNAHVSNCVFDMRHGWTPPGGLVVPGPEIAVLLQKPYYVGTTWAGYYDQRVLIANNTFLLAEYGAQFRQSRSTAVAVMDVTEPCGAISLVLDPVAVHRGVGNAVLLNNLFRTEQNLVGIQSSHMAFLGMDDPDLHANASPLTTPTPPFFASNALAPERVGTLAGSPTAFSNNWYDSMPVASAVVAVLGPTTVIVNHTGAPGAPVATPPVLPPAVTLWDGFSGPAGWTVQEFDPRFVGELVSTNAANYNPTSGPVLDLRLLPDSPLIDMGVTPSPGYSIMGMNGSVFPESPCSRIMTFDWDGEEYGNPRLVRGIDIGFDEFHELILCGSYGSDSNSHGSLDPDPMALHLNASAPQGTIRRVILLPSAAAGKQMKLFGVLKRPTTLAAWTQPMGTLVVPIIDPNKPMFFQTRYINDLHPGCSPTGTWPWAGPPGNTLPTAPFVWSQLAGAPLQTLPPGQGSSQVVLVEQIDNDTLAPKQGCTPILEAYFSTQAEITYTGSIEEVRWTNLQAEYR